MVDEGGLGVEFLGGADGLDHRLDLRLQVVRLVDHVLDLRIHAAALPGEEVDLVEDAEDLVGIDGAEREVVVGVAAVVEVEAAEHVFIEQPRDDLLDVLRKVVMAGVDQHLGLRAGLFRGEEGHPPVGEVGLIEGGFEGLVFDQQDLLRREVAVGFLEGGFEAVLAGADAVLAGVVGAIGEPQRDRLAAGLLAELDAVDDVGERLVAGGFEGAADRAEFVELVLEDVRIDRAHPDAQRAGLAGDGGGIGAGGEVPQDVRRDGRAAGSQPVDVGGIGELVVDIDRRGGLVELAETGARVRVAPGRGFNAEGVEGAVDGFR